MKTHRIHQRQLSTVGYYASVSTFQLQTIIRKVVCCHWHVCVFHLYLESMSELKDR